MLDYIHAFHYNKNTNILIVVVCREFTLRSTTTSIYFIL